jgi:hypothetical protein
MKSTPQHTATLRRSKGFGPNRNTQQNNKGCVQLQGKTTQNFPHVPQRIMPSFCSDQKMKLSPINFFENIRPIPANENPEWLLQFLVLGR